MQRGTDSRRTGSRNEMEGALHKLRAKLAIDLQPAQLTSIEKGVREQLSSRLLRCGGRAGLFVAGAGLRAEAVAAGHAPRRAAPWREPRHRRNLRPAVRCTNLAQVQHLPGGRGAGLQQRAHCKPSGSGAPVLPARAGGGGDRPAALSATARHAARCALRRVCVCLPAGCQPAAGLARSAAVFMSSACERHMLLHPWCLAAWAWGGCCKTELSRADLEGHWSRRPPPELTHVPRPACLQWGL